MPVIPDTIFGEDSDDLLAYQTPKVAHIRDRNVGTLYYCLVSLALCWVIFGQIFWRNEHFMLKDVRGISRMWASHPTKQLCDANNADCEALFKPMSELPYCEEYDGEDKTEFAARCMYGDKHSVFSDGTLGPRLFIPTSVIAVREHKHCTPSAENKFSCDNEYRKAPGQYKSDYYFDVRNMMFYANIEDYRIQFTSTYHRDHIKGTSLQHPGFLYECFDDNKDEYVNERLKWEDRIDPDHQHQCKDQRRVAIKCIPGIECNKGGLKSFEDVKIKVDGGLVDLQMHAESSGRVSRALRQQRKHFNMSFSEKDKSQAWGKEAKPDYFASTYGDTFRLGKLLEMAGVNLDKHLSVDGESARMAGIILEVEIVYSNLRKFLSSLGMSQVQYTYRVKERKLPYVSKESLSPSQPENYPETREYLIQHGIMVEFVVAGEFGFFNPVYLLIMLTTALALLGTAHKVTDLTAMYIHPRKKIISI
jgi:hypothetical protein